MTYGYRYSRWDGTQKIFDVDEEALMDELSNDLMDHGDVWRALRDLLQRGVRNRQGDSVEGLKQLMERLRNRRQENLQRYNVDSIFDDIKERLQNVVKAEREGIERRLQETRGRADQAPEADREQTQKLLQMLEERANRSREKLDNLPENPGGAIKELSDYDFMDPEARRQFQELLDMLKQRMMQNYFQDLKQQLQGMTPEQMAGLRQMLRDLNQMLQD
ncbi:MAG: VWA domain-containing protein, partial [Chloroflexi bacterium]|nr:VWA domain-containing protein [Chloroflexota bacterium]